MKRVHLFPLTIFLLVMMIIIPAYSQIESTAVHVKELSYSRADVVLKDNRITLTLYFVDTKADSKTMLTEKQSVYTEKMQYTWEIDTKTSIVNTNQQYLFSKNESNLQLYIGVYWDKAVSQNPTVCVSSEPIKDGWWR